MHREIIMEAWKLIILLSCTWVGGYIWGLRDSKFSLEDDDIDEEES